MIVPRVMGSALGAHPLLVIFALVAGAELYGIFGALLALPRARHGPRGRDLPAPAHPARALADERPGGRRARRHRAGADRARTTRLRVSADAPLIACAGLIKSFGGRQVLGPVDLALAARAIALALLGPERRGQDDAAVAAGGLGRGRAPGSVQRPELREIGVVPQRPALYRRLSARENLELFARLAGVPEPEAELAELTAAVALGDALDRPVERLSLGQAQRVNVAIGLLGTPARRAAGRAHGRARPRPPAGALGHARARQRARRCRCLRDPERRGGATRRRPRARARRGALRVCRARRTRSGARPGPSTRPAGTSARSSPSSSERGAPREPVRAAAAQGSAAARALAAADRRARRSTRSCSRCSSAASSAARARGRAWRS